jgi:hypothetical protein
MTHPFLKIIAVVAVETVNGRFTVSLCGQKQD